MPRSTNQAVEMTADMRVVILRGPERYLRDAYTRHLIDALRARHGEIEQFSFDGTSAEPAEVLDELRSYGLLQSHKLVVVDQAEKLLAARDEAEARRKTPRELLERYAEAPVDGATLLLRAETWRPGRLDKAVAKIGAIVKCEQPDARTAAGWCRGRCEKEHGCAIETSAARLLVERIGPQLARLDVELGKLASFVGEGGTIGDADVRELVGLGREEQAWVVQSALLRGPGEALGKLRELRDVSRQPDALLVWAITDLLRKVHAAARLLADGAPAAAVASRLKLWGEAREAVLSAARRLDADRCGQLLGDAIDADFRVKRGIGRGPRTLEVLAVRVADTLR